MGYRCRGSVTSINLDKKDPSNVKKFFTFKSKTQFDPSKNGVAAKTGIFNVLFDESSSKFKELDANTEIIYTDDLLELLKLAYEEDAIFEIDDSNALIALKVGLGNV